MYAVAFDLVVAETQKHHPRGVTQAYTEIGAVLGRHATFAPFALSSGRILLPL